MTKQYYIPGKEYQWTKETWGTALERIEYVLADHYGPFTQPKGDVKGFSEYEYGGKSYTDNLDLCWEFLGEEKYWRFSVSDGGVEIPEYLIPFYGEKETKEILYVDDLEVGKEYIMSLAVNEDWNIIYWGKNTEVIFITELLYHTHAHTFIKDIFHFRNIPEKTREEKLSEKYNVRLDTIKQMVEDGLIQEEED